jgi:hypothetical protein
MTIWYQSQQNPHKKITTPLPAYHLFDEMPMSMFHPHMASLLQLKQKGSVVEYTTMYWECLHRVLDLDPSLNIKSFVHQYVEGLRDDIQAAVRSRSPSSITGASALARIREDEIRKEAAMGDDKVGVNEGFTPMENLNDTIPEPAAPGQCRASCNVTTIDVGCRSTLTLTKCSMEGPRRDATVTDIFPKPAAAVVCQVDHGVVAMDAINHAAVMLATCFVGCPMRDTTIDVFPKLVASELSDKTMKIDSVSLLAPTAAMCSTGGLTHGDVNNPVVEPLITRRVTSSSTAPKPLPTPPQQISSILELGTLPLTRWSGLCLNDDIGVLTPTFQLDVTLSIKQQGQMLRPSPWPSFVAENTTITHSGILEPPLSPARASNWDVLPYFILPPLLSTLEASPRLSSESIHARTVGQREASHYWRSVSRVVTTVVPPPVTDVFQASSYLYTVGFCALSQEIMLEDIHREPSQFDYLLPPAKPPDGYKGAATVVSYKSCARFSTRGFKDTALAISSSELVLNYYNFMVRNEYGSASMFCDAIRNCDTCLESLLLTFGSTPEYPCYIMNISQWWVLLVTVQSLMGDGPTYVRNQLAKILETCVQSHGKINVVFSCPCSEQINWLHDSLEALIFWRLEKWTCTQSVQPANAVFEAHYKFLAAAEIFSIKLQREIKFLHRDLQFVCYTGLHNGP